MINLPMSGAPVGPQTQVQLAPGPRPMMNVNQGMPLSGVHPASFAPVAINSPVPMFGPPAAPALPGRGVSRNYVKIR